MDERLYPSRREALEELMRNRGLIKFTITSEPPEELQDTHDCQDLGFVFLFGIYLWVSVQYVPCLLNVAYDILSPV